MWMLPILAAVTQVVLLTGNPSTVVINDHTFTAEVSRTFEQKIKGLMSREKLADNSCMIFLYDTDDNRQVWMEGTRIPLDVVWLSASGKVVEIQENVQPCPSVYNPGMCPGFGGEVLSRHFIEFPAGTITKIRVKLGDDVILNHLLPDDD